MLFLLLMLFDKERMSMILWSQHQVIIRYLGRYHYLLINLPQNIIYFLLTSGALRIIKTIHINVHQV